MKEEAEAQREQPDQASTAGKRQQQGSNPGGLAPELAR